MSKNNNQHEVNTWLAYLSIFIGIFTSLATFLLDIRGLNLLRGFTVAGLLITTGFVAWLSFKTSFLNLKLQFVILLFLYVVSATLFTWIGTWVKSKTKAWPLESVQFYDFETEADLGDWITETEISNEQSFSGEKALKATFPISTKETTFYLNWEHEFEADVVVGQIFWPIQDDINLEWAQVCIPFENWSCTFISNKQGWNTFVLDLSEMETLDNQSTLDEVMLPGIVFQGVIKTTNLNIDNIPVYVDSLQIYDDSQNDETSP